MLNQNEALSQLWQRQETVTPDIERITVQLKKERRKQKWYAVIDVLGLLPCFILFPLVWEKMQGFEIFWLIVVTALCTAYTLYLFRLRRQIVNSEAEDTQSYVSHLQRQLRLKLKIVKITRWSIIAVVPAIASFYLGAWFFSERDPQFLWQRFGLTLIVLAVVFIPFWFWTKTRAARFKDELRRLTLEQT